MRFPLLPRRDRAVSGLVALTLPLVAMSWLGGCAHVAPAPPVGPLFHDEYFAPPAHPVDPAAVFAFSEPMRRFAETELATANSNRDRRRSLIEALFQHGKLQLDYDASSTRNAAETFDARAGNCLSLVLMTGAFAHHLGLPVTFRSVLVDPQYSRNAGLTFENGHVNLLLAARLPHPIREPSDLIVDFMPVGDAAVQRVQVVEENTIVAMYMNNRAAETMAEGQLDESYGWARAALLQDPRLAAAATTLAVIYLRGGHPQAAVAALQHALAVDADNRAALSNLVLVLRSSGRDAEAEAMAARLARLQPYPPFHFFDLGRKALDAGDAVLARDLFLRELQLQPCQDEVHYWAAQAYWRLGDGEQASRHLRLAVDYSPTLVHRQLYSAKLERLRNLHVQ